jgi:hypothetical protein
MDDKSLPAAEVQKNQLVQCKGYRCMAYLDSLGKWRAAFGGQELIGFLFVVPE